MPDNEVFTTEEYREVYPDGIELHFWNLGRNHLVYRWLRPHLQEGDLVMDVGCGTGLVVADLLQRGCNAQGVELGAAPVLHGLEQRVKTGCDLFSLDETTRLQVRAALLLDVIEHIQDREQFLQRLREALPNCMTLLVTVPARQELWSGYDAYWGHYLRYNRQQLRDELLTAGFEPRRTSYFFQGLYLVSLLLKLLGIPKGTGFQPIRRGTVTALLHRLLGFAAKLENRTMPGALPGSSLACVALRQAD